MGVNWRERRLIRNLYMGHRVKLRLNQGETDSVKIGRGVRRGCGMSPILFDLYGEYLMKEALAEIGDFNVEVRIDTGVIAKTQEELQDKENRLAETERKYEWKSASTNPT